MARYPCPCCGYLTLPESPPGTYAICPVCAWEDDPVQFTDDRYAGGANHVCLAEARENFIRTGAAAEGMRQHVRPPREDEIP
jgi:rubredoxin